MPAVRCLVTNPRQRHCLQAGEPIVRGCDRGLVLGQPSPASSGTGQCHGAQPGQGSVLAILGPAGLRFALVLP